MEKIFKWFGYIPQSRFTATEKALSIANSTLHSLLNKENADIEPFFKNTEDLPWHEYWREAYEPLYMAKHMKNATKYPKLLPEFMYRFSKFNWQKVAAYMKKTDWTWGSDNFSPTVRDLQSTVIELYGLCISVLEKGEDFKPQCSTGGFEVKIDLDKNEVLITFNYKL